MSLCIRVNNCVDKILVLYVQILFLMNGLFSTSCDSRFDNEISFLFVCKACPLISFFVLLVI